MSGGELPVVEGCLFRDDPHRAAQALRAGLETCGFFQISGHGIAPEIVADIRAAARSFFALPTETKAEIAIDRNNRGYLAEGMARMEGAADTDLKEVFFWGRDLGADDDEVRAGVPLCGPNRWPGAPPGFREAVLAYHRDIATLGDNVLSAIALSLDAPADFFAPFYARSMTRGQLIRYRDPGAQGRDRFGVAPHTDFGCITLLLQETPGLEVQMGDDWVAVPPGQETLVVNIGDLLERWTNGRYVSTRHRVRNLSGADRYSIAMFHDPDAQAIVDPRDLVPDSQSGFEPIGAADYILKRNSRAFSHYKQAG